MMKPFALLTPLLLLAACSSSSTERKLAETQARAEAAEKRLEAIEKKLDPAKAETAAKNEAPPPTQTAPTPAAPPEPVVHVVPAGTAIVVRTTSLISTKTANVNDRITAHLEQPVFANGVMIAPKGSLVSGVVTASNDGGRVKGKASIAIALTGVVDAKGRTHAIATPPYGQVAKSGVKGDVVKTGVGAGIGAAIGAIAGGSKGAAIGAGAGAGGGAGVVLATRGPAAEIAPESVLRFTLSRPLRVTQ